MLKSLNVGELTPKDEIHARINKLKAKMEEQGIALAIILQNVDLFYLTGTMQKSVLAVSVDRDPVFFVEKSLQRAAEETPLEITPIKRDKDIRDILSDLGMLRGRCGMELDVLPVTVFERWKNILGYDNVVDVWPLIRDLRLIKSPFEIRQVKQSGEIVSQVFKKAKEIIHEGMREVDIAALLESEGRIHGHQGFLRMRGLNQEMMNVYIVHGLSGTVVSGADVPISGAGVTHAIPQGPSVNRFQRGIPLLVDYGGGYNGYITDETRTFALGELKDIYLKGHAVAQAIIEETMDFAKEGIIGTEVFTKAFLRAKREGLDEYFMGYGEGKVSFIGHGLGLEINELPVITPRHDIVLQEGMVFAFEPKFIIPGEGSIGIEVDFIVRKDGLERVTDSPIDIVYV
ncbi:MAG: Xaa-Pro peptidase family protein [Syntrophorhabdaceae bacterium]|nr:Xaa-Pro peptidase family protein [Syntrophorhabdaceae bacterium]